MKHLFYILLFVSVSNYSFGQDGCVWNFKFKFKLETKETIRYRYKNLEVFFNDTYTYEQFRGYELKFDSLTKEYSLLLDYGCISCGFPNADFPPELYLKINLENDKHSVPFSTMIPIYFQKLDGFGNVEFGKNEIIDLGTIDIKHFITDNYWKDEIETFEVIEVKSINSIHFRKSNRYKPRRMNRLVKLEVKH